jgi:hypothetical protein
MSDAIPSIVGDNVVFTQEDNTVTIHFDDWNEYVEIIGYRAPAEDKNCPPQRT